jgi:hypothetical protein
MHRWFLLFCLPFALKADPRVDYLRQYIGRWLGDFTIHSGATGYTETFPIEQRYWWEDEQLHGLSVAETDWGIEAASSRALILDGSSDWKSLGERKSRATGVSCMMGESYGFPRI